MSSAMNVLHNACVNHFLSVSVFYVGAHAETAFCVWYMFSDTC